MAKRRLFSGKAEAALTTSTGPPGCQLHQGGKELDLLPHPGQAVVTCAFSFKGRYVAHRLLHQKEFRMVSSAGHEPLLHRRRRS